MKSRAVLAFFAVVCAGGILSFFLPWLSGFSRPGYWALVLMAAVLAAFLAPRRTSGGSLSLLGKSEFLCDTCRYNNERDCSRPERPNATRCDEYKRR
jgi:hypothetical protein